MSESQRRARLARASLAAPRGVDVLLLRIRAALVIRSRSFRPMSLARSSSGAVSITEWTWLAACVRAFIALRRATRSSRIDSTVPVAAFGVPTASPASTARAAASASAGSDLPRFRRAWRFGRFTSITSTPASVRNRASPAPHEPVPSTPTAPSWPKPLSHLSNDRYPRRVVGNCSVPSTGPARREPRRHGSPCVCRRHQ